MAQPGEQDFEEWQELLGNITDEKDREDAMRQVLYSRSRKKRAAWQAFLTSHGYILGSQDFHKLHEIIEEVHSAKEG